MASEGQGKGKLLPAHTEVTEAPECPDGLVASFNNLAVSYNARFNGRDTCRLDSMYRDAILAGDLEAPAKGERLELPTILQGDLPCGFAPAVAQ